jgi:hypothetical protein
MKKPIIVIVGIGLIIIVIATFVYFVTGVSSTYAPIRKYEFSGNTDQFVAGLRNYISTTSKMTYKITDKTGNETNGYATYISIEAGNIEYSLKCESYNNKTRVSLVGIYDKVRNVGGYSKEAKGIDTLANQFELKVLKPLQGNQKMKFTTL